MVFPLIGVRLHITDFFEVIISNRLLNLQAVSYSNRIFRAIIQSTAAIFYIYNKFGIQDDSFVHREKSGIIICQ